MSRRVTARWPRHEKGVRRRSGTTTVEVAVYGSTVVVATLTPHLMGRDRALPIRFRDDGPHPGPTHPFKSF